MISVAYDFAHSPATQFMARPQHLLIDGRRVPASSGRTFKSLNPATGQVIATIAEGGARPMSSTRWPLRAGRSKAHGARCGRRSAAGS